MPFFSLPSTGGGGGGPPPRLAYHHQQDLPAAIWAITHGLGFRPAGVQVTDVDGASVEGQITHADESTLVITFSQPLAGVADLS